MTYVWIECSLCDREFESSGYMDVEHHEGRGTRREFFPYHDGVCSACRGELQCEGTNEYIQGVLLATPCSSKGTTRICLEEDGSKTVVAVLCDKCAASYGEDGDQAPIEQAGEE